MPQYTINYAKIQVADRASNFVEIILKSFRVNTADMAINFHAYSGNRKS